jgi:hypothetical protein
VRLTRKAASDDNRQDTASLKHRIACNILDAAKADAIGKVLVIDGAGEGFDFGVGDGSKTALLSVCCPVVPLLGPTPLPPCISAALGVGHSVGDFCGEGEAADS